MQSLYKRFIVLGLLFVSVTVTLHWIVWTRSEGDVELPWIERPRGDRVEERVDGRPPRVADVRGILEGRGAHLREEGRRDDAEARAEHGPAARRSTNPLFLPGALPVVMTPGPDSQHGHADQDPARPEPTKSADDVGGAAHTLPFIYDARSGFDRIPEQMAFVPEPPRRRGGTEDILRRRVIALESGPGGWNVKRGAATFHEHKCPVRNCELIDAQAVPEGVELDAVLFRQEAGVDLQSLARHRTPDTVYIVFILESPHATRSYRGLEGVFNWTATYRRQSTMVAPYERWMMFPNASLPANASRNYAKGKSKGAAMFVSNCGADNDRLEVARELGKHYPVDIYGACGDKKCPRFNERCFDMLNTDYRFYLAFENTNCRDYITEKFFVNGLGNDVVPIVMGAHPNDYKKAAPPHSYIHVEDFPNVARLGQYLRELEADDDLYNDYFRWKGTGKFLDTKFWCRLCAMVSDGNKPKLVVKDLEDWWRGKRVCRLSRWQH